MIDEIILALEEKAKSENKHLIKTESVLNRLMRRVDLSDDNPIREDYLTSGAKDAINSRLNALGYNSVRLKNQCGYFVRIDECLNIAYLNSILLHYLKITNGYEKQTEERIKAQIKKVRSLKLDGQMYFDGEMEIQRPISEDEFDLELEADAV